MSFTKIPKRFPTNAKIIAFCFFEGAVLSVPVGILLSYIRPFTPPDWTAPVYFSTVAFSVLALLVWSLMYFRDQPDLARIGLLTFSTFILIFVLGSLFPALN